MKIYLKKIQNYFELIFSDRKKLFQTLSIILACGIMLMVISDTYESSADEAEKNDTIVEGQSYETDISQQVSDNAVIDSKAEQKNVELVDAALELEDDLKEILTTILGNNNVKVLVTYETSEEDITAYDYETETDNEIQSENKTAEEESSSSGNKESSGSKKQHIYQEVKTKDTETKKPIVVKTIMPKVQGILIVTTNKLSYQMQVDICSAVSTVAGVGVHKINIIQGGQK